MQPYFEADPLTIFEGDALAIARGLDTDTADMVITSPPYMDARTYSRNDVQRNAEAWIVWMLPIVAELVRVSRGPVFINCAGVTRDWQYWPGCEGLAYRAFQAGICQRRPCYWYRHGIPGSGGPDYLRADVEYVLCFTRPGRFCWSDNLANGHPPKYEPGGPMSHRTKGGQRANSERKAYTAPALANPGNLITGIPVGKGHMGHDLAHRNEAPFPVKLAAWFIRSFCPPGGTVYDPFAGSGTTGQAAIELGRRAILSDLRADQCATMQERLTPLICKAAA
jgi:site-specific DNA-methyltransferase (adenine-specific)